MLNCVNPVEIKTAMLNIHLIAGARPNFMKVAALYHALHVRVDDARSRGINLKVSVVHTGQHYDPNMSDVFFADLGIPVPAWHLQVGSGSHAEQTAAIMVAFEKVCTQDRPSLVIVVGDVNSTIACALTAKKLGIKVAHVEAGLRSFDERMPEEINRKLTDAISDFLFVTEESGIRNLRAEGVASGKIHMVGNVMIDTLMRNVARIENGAFKSTQEIEMFTKKAKKYAVLTLHRPSNVDSKEVLQSLWEGILEIAREIPILFPVHPRTRKNIGFNGLRTSGVTMIDPIGYLDMLYAVKGSTMVLTDSGGLQEESTVLGIPCLTIRENTERPATVDVGTNYLVGTNPATIVKIAREVLSGKGKKGGVPSLWDGKAAERIADTIFKQLGYKFT